MLYRISIHLRKEDLKYAEILADTFEVPRNLVIRLLIEKAIELHKDGKLRLFAE